jgi:tetratricopeptide (TPR) repeat protein
MVVKRSLRQAALARLFLAGAALAAALVLGTGSARASGSGPAPMPRSPSGGGSSMSAPQVSPEEQASMKYNHGLKAQEKADETWKEAMAATDEKKRGKAEESAKKGYEKAKDDYEAALKLDPEHYQAQGALGYVLRRLGNYDASLDAYAKALKIKPGFTPAIEYRGEAYLGLNRVEDAKADYMTLFASDRPHADQLAAAMKSWVEARRKDPKGVDPAAVEDFSKWLDSRKEIAAQTSALLPPKDARW